MKRLGMFLVLLSVSMFIAAGCNDTKKKEGDKKPPVEKKDDGGTDKK
ncbi:MAG: hypothetical protein JW741_10315 [Sedimentisphaerales bacterium]|nr:hypothetical protein [Sedimentisphaerales bacterium]